MIESRSRIHRQKIPKKRLMGGVNPPSLGDAKGCACPDLNRGRALVCSNEKGIV